MVDDGKPVLDTATEAITATITFHLAAWLWQQHDLIEWFWK